MDTVTHAAAMMLVAVAIDGLFGWPEALFRRIGHPVTWLGRLIGFLDNSLNRADASDLARRIAGVISALVVIGVAAGAGFGAAALLPEGWRGILIGGVLAWPLVAAHSLHAHVTAVAEPLSREDLPLARKAVAMIVGRDPDQLDDAGVARAAIESLAENTSDGVVAPLFWGLILGLPGIAAYKAINTLDSMIGHRTLRHEAFGWASARIDDVANLVPARLSGLLFALVSPHPRAAFAVMLRDASRHRSPNAGWPEAAMAGALGIRLSGPRAYAGRVSGEPFVNEGAPDPRPDDLFRALRLYRLLVFTLAGSLGAVVLLWQ